MKHSALLITSLFLVAFAARSASATVVYTQPELNPTLYGYFSEGSAAYQVYDNFTLSSPSTVTDVSWFGGTDTGFAPTSFQIGFYADAAGVPGAQLAANNVTVNGVDTGLPVFTGGEYGYELYSFDSAVNPISFAAGTQYWVSIIDFGTAYQYLWADGTGGDGNSYDANADPTSSGTDEAFTLNGTVAATPEPSSLVLAGTGILSLAGAVRRRLKK